MPHLSRLLALSCALTFLFASLPSEAGIGDKDLPLLNGQKTKLLYTVVGVRDSLNSATVFHCTSTERTGGKDIRLGIEVFYSDGGLANNVAVGEGRVDLIPGQTSTLSTRETAVFFVDRDIGARGINQGSARIFADSKNVLCSAMIVDPLNDPPAAMVMLPVFKGTKQGGM
jgi:hypothetical protein